MANAFVIGIAIADAFELSESINDCGIGEARDGIEDGQRVALVLELLVLPSQQ